MEPNHCSNQEILEALEFWLQGWPNPEERNFEWDGARYSPAEIVDHVKGKTLLGVEFVETIRSLSQKLKIDPREVILISFGDDAEN